MLPRPLRARAHRIANELIQRGWAKVRFSGAIAPGTRAAEAFGSFGEGSVVAFPFATVYGQAQIHIGADTLVSTWCTLAAGYSPAQETVPTRALVIGDRCVVGIRSALVAHESIEIADDVWFGQEVFVTDANHGYADPRTPIGRQLGPHEPVRIGAGSWIGHGAVILPGTTIGRNVVVAARSVVRGNVADHAVIGGVPAKVIRRYVPGLGWERTDGAPGVTEPLPTLSPEELAKVLEQLEAQASAPSSGHPADAPPTVDPGDVALIDADPSLIDPDASLLEEGAAPVGDTVRVDHRSSAGPSAPTQRSVTS
ncbi:acyltransferase [soil metagenome]